MTDLAILGPGEFFGESALVEEAFRSASALAVSPCVLFELFRGDLGRWSKANAQQVVQFFAELLNAQSERLRRTSDELALHSELSDRALDPGVSAADFLSRLLERAIRHLGGGLVRRGLPGRRRRGSARRGDGRTGGP